MNLNLKIHPPIVALISAVISWGLDKLFPVLKYNFGGKIWLTLLLLAMAGYLGLIGIKQFYKVSTTIHPHKPQHTKTLVTDGIYHFSRNPMYLGLLSGLLAITVWLSNPVSVIGPVFFMIYITHFQIKPEEEILKEKFGKQYVDYLRKVRRWI